MVLSILLYSCQNADGNKTGSEYMPDMAHSIAIESNVYKDYKLNSWNDESTISLKEFATSRLPVKGTVPRGYAGVSLMQGGSKEDVLAMLNGNNGGIAVPVNGSVPYYYEDTEEDRTRATQDMQVNPFPITKAGLEKGEELYNIFVQFVMALQEILMMVFMLLAFILLRPLTC
ncbi:MAG: hypothetical protein HC892_17810 [Saprospiraceae bacterium]|nr:hypothetical protein [Saprospiraceae bacterium]